MAMHYGFRPDTWIMLAVAESGGFSLEWFKRTCLPQTGYDEINRVLARRDVAAADLIFLPDLTGANAPEYDTDTCGLFYGLRAAQAAVTIRKRIQPRQDPVWQRRYRQFLALYEAMKEVRSLAWKAVFSSGCRHDPASRRVFACLIPAA